MTSKHELAANLALALTVKLFPNAPTLGDVRLVAQGRTHLWPEWTAQPEDLHRSVAVLLAHRPDDLAEDLPLWEQLRAVVDAANDFEIAGAANLDSPMWSSPFRVVAGADLDRRMREWSEKLRTLGSRAAQPEPVPLQGAGDVGLVADGVSYRVPAADLPTAGRPHPEVRTTAPTDSVELDERALLDLARRIDRADRDGPGMYEHVAIEQFLARFVAGDNEPVRRFESGVTRLAVAPTGTGKSVFARLAALQLASEGMPVALVVPDIQAVWKEVLRLDLAASRANLDLRVTPLSSWRNAANHLARHLDHPIAEDSNGRWALSTVAYSCHLVAYAEDGNAPPRAGLEPCTRLRQPDPARSSARRVACPFRNECGRFASFERALSADIIVINHHAFLAGRVPYDVVVDGRSPRKISTAELVLRRCGVVFIDEIDVLQENAIGADSRSLVLSSRGRLSKPSRLYTEVERRRAESRTDTGIRFERGRSALLRIMHEAERLSELVNTGELEWPERGRMTWREAHDAWLAKRLYGDDDDALDRLWQLFDREPIAADPISEQLRVALSPLGPGLGDGTLMVEVRAAIMRSLANWPLRLRRPADVQRERDRIAGRLIVRAVIVQLDRALGHLRPQLPGLEQHDVEQAAELRDDLLGYSPWQPSPVGPLGRRLYGYAFSQRLEEQGALETRVMSGDPHGLVRELGGQVALALAEAPRIVLGFSATCRFRGSPRADVLGELAGWVTDAARNVRVIGAPVDARISGVGNRAERMEAARSAAGQLWTSMLHRYLLQKLDAPESAGRARALLVTGSYDEARAVADGLRRASGPDLTIRFLVSGTPDDSPATPDSLPRSALESFGTLAAPAVLVGPLAVVARGHNILQPGTALSALSGIFVLTRPVPPSDDAARFLAHLSYNARMFPPTWQGAASATLEAERRGAWRRLRTLQSSPATFRNMDPELRRELVCDVLADLAQLAGRARRGGTPVELVFVDAAFRDEIAPWQELVGDVLEWWRERGWLPQMARLHGAFIAGLADYAGVQINASSD